MLLLDSFEKLRGDLRNARDVRDSVEAIFVREADQLRLPCHAVYTVPPWVRFTEVGPGLALGPVQIVPMCRISNRHAGPAQRGRAPCHEAGIDAMVALLGRRFDIDLVFRSDRLLRELAAASGGYPKDLLGYVREVLVHARSKDAGVPLDAERQERYVSAVLRGKSREFELALPDDLLPMVVQVASEHDVHPRDAEQAERVAELFDHHFVLAYKNGEEWFDLHPMLRRTERVQPALPQHAPGSADGS